MTEKEKENLKKWKEYTEYIRFQGHHLLRRQRFYRSINIAVVASLIAAIASVLNLIILINSH